MGAKKKNDAGGANKAAKGAAPTAPTRVSLIGRRKTKVQQPQIGFAAQGMTTAEYQLDGDESFYTEESLMARGNLRRHPDIVQWLKK